MASAPDQRPFAAELVGGRPDDLGDAELVAAIASGSEEALAEAFRRHAAAIYGLAIRILSCAAAADDVAQEVFVRLWQQPDRFDAERGALRAYLLAIAHGRAIDHIRTEGRRRRREVNAGSNGHAEDVESAVIDLTTSDWVTGGLAKLPARERRLLELTYFGGYSYREAATITGLPEGTVKSRIRSGMERLAHLLEPRED